MTTQRDRLINTLNSISGNEGIADFILARERQLVADHIAVLERIKNALPNGMTNKDAYEIITAELNRIKGEV